MKKVIKITGMILGAIVVGGFMGWCFNLAGYEPAVSVAIILAIFAGVEPMMMAKKEK